MKDTLWWMGLVVAALVAGCGKSKSANTPQASTNSASAEVAGADAAPQAPVHGSDLQPAPVVPMVVADTGDTSANLSRLSLELRKYVARTRTAPKSFEEFLASSQVQAPPAPPGKKYFIQSGAVILVNQ